MIAPLNANQSQDFIMSATKLNSTIPRWNWAQELRFRRDVLGWKYRQEGAEPVLK